jgi:peptidoglycan/LPS O-acetylase OafA/YrhL
VLSLDGLRGFALLLVLYAHLSSALKSQSGDPWPASFVLETGQHYGSMGVDLFFVLSGFLITRILFSTKTNPYCLRNFYIRRVLRIFPVYYGFLFLCLVLLPLGLSDQTLLTLFGEPKYHPWLWFYGTNLIKSIIPKDLFHALEHFWSLAVDEHYYGAWPMVVLKLGVPTLRRLCIYLIIMAVVMRFIFNFFGNSVGAYVFTLCRLDGFAVGALVAIIEQKANFNPEAMQVPRGMIICTIVSFILVWLCGGNGILVPSLSSFAFGLMVFAAVKYRSFQRPFESYIMRALGRYSYGTYVCHLLILYILQLYFPQTLALTGNRQVDVLLFYALGFSIPLMIGIASYHLMEKRFLDLKDVLASR